MPERRKKQVTAIQLEKHRQLAWASEAERIVENSPEEEITLGYHERNIEETFPFNKMHLLAGIRKIINIRYKNAVADGQKDLADRMRTLL